MRKERTTRYFSKRQSSDLLQNPYVASITSCQISYTVAFKKIFWELYSVEKMRPKEIMQRLGFDVEVLGADRISQIPRLLKAQLDEYGDFHEGRKPTIIPTPKSIENPRALRIDPQTAIQLEKMQHELEYVGQKRTAEEMIHAKPEVKYELIHEMISCDNNLLNISWLCEVAGVSRSGYYRWVAAEPHRIQKEINDRTDFNVILEAYNHRGYAKGVRGIYMTLLHHEPPIVMNLKKIRRLMRKYNLECPIRKANPYRKILREMYGDRIEENLVNREFTEHGPRKILLTDITYIRRGGESGFTYLSTIIDAFTMEVLSFALSDSLKVDFVLETVESLIQNHGKSRCLAECRNSGTLRSGSSLYLLCL